jgi:hypothetical protein
MCKGSFLAGSCSLKLIARVNERNHLQGAGMTLTVEMVIAKQHNE